MRTLISGLALGIALTAFVFSLSGVFHVATQAVVRHFTQDRRAYVMQECRLAPDFSECRERVEYEKGW